MIWLKINKALTLFIRVTEAILLTSYIRCPSTKNNLHPLPVRHSVSHARRTSQLYAFPHSLITFFFRYSIKLTHQSIQLLF